MSADMPKRYLAIIQFKADTSLRDLAMRLPVFSSSF
jgi:hypothetical protein